MGIKELARSLQVTMACPPNSLNIRELCVNPLSLVSAQLHDIVGGSLQERMCSIREMGFEEI